MTFIREPLQVVEIVEPRCSRTFGTAPCLATGERCYNTDATCKFITALNLTASAVTRFVMPAANRVLAAGFQPGTAIPALISVDTAPTVLNVGAGNDDLSPLGARAVATVAIKDFPYNDVGFDPYLSTRTHDPVTRGSFWTKWLARNPFHVGYTLRIYDGYFGDDLSAMIMREYSIEKIDASRSSVRITAKDILRKITDTGVKAPALSNGVLSLAIGAADSSFTVAGAVLADYPATGWVRIGNEIIAYTSRTTSGSNLSFTGLTRGALNTTAAAQSQNSRVQRVLAYVNQPFSDIIYDLLTAWGKIPTGFIDKTAWDAEFNEWRALYMFTGYITEPTDVDRLVGELSQQGLANIWWDERVQKIIFRAQRPNFAPRTITQEGDIVADSFVVTEHPKDRASQVYVYYSPRNPTLSLTDKNSFAFAEAFIDVDKERQYGEAKVKEIFCRWVPSSVIARTLGQAYLLRFRDVRKQITFTLTAKDIGDVWTGTVLQVRHFMLTDFSGLERVAPWLITSAETVEQGGTYRFVAEDNESGGLLWEFVADLDSRPVTEIGCWVDAAGTDGAGNIIPYGWV
ncbi:putative tail protein [Pseudanabaena phage Pan4]|nr:putative tail protein [Pseudanabaena phage Pan4]